jgi:hypothetical protein
MQVHHVGYRVRGFYRVADLEHLWEMKNDSKKSHRSDTIELVRDRFRRYVLTVIDPVSASAFAVDARHTARVAEAHVEGLAERLRVQRHLRSNAHTLESHPLLDLPEKPQNECSCGT